MKSAFTWWVQRQCRSCYVVKQVTTAHDEDGLTHRVKPMVLLEGVTEIRVCAAIGSP